jgi:hypothetical protein
MAINSERGGVLAGRHEFGVAGKPGVRKRCLLAQSVVNSCVLCIRARLQPSRKPSAKSYFLRTPQARRLLPQRLRSA